MVVHILVHTWRSREEERRYKEGKDGEYERLVLKPLERLEMVQMRLEPVLVKEKEDGERKQRSVM